MAGDPREDELEFNAFEGLEGEKTAAVDEGSPPEPAPFDFSEDDGLEAREEWEPSEDEPQHIATIDDAFDLTGGVESETVEADVDEGSALESAPSHFDEDDGLEALEGAELSEVEQQRITISEQAEAHRSQTARKVAPALTLESVEEALAALLAEEDKALPFASKMAQAAIDAAAFKGLDQDEKLDLVETETPTYT